VLEIEESSIKTVEGVYVRWTLQVDSCIRRIIWLALLDEKLKCQIRRPLIQKEAYIGQEYQGIGVAQTAINRTHYLFWESVKGWKVGTASHLLKWELLLIS
jgi:hypothetical protein